MSKKYKKNKICWLRVYCECVSPNYLQVGKLRQRPDSDDSCELPISSDCSVISISHFPHIARHPTISGLFLVQMLRYELLVKLHRIQAGDKLLQRPVNPNSRHKLFPMYHCIALQHDQYVINKNSLDEQL